MALILAIAALVIGIVLMLYGRRVRETHGMIDAPTLDIDTETLRSRRLGLAARPDTVVREGDIQIPVELKSAKRVYPNHLVQLGVQLILIEEVHGKRPTHGYFVTGDGERHRVENTDELRAWVLKEAEELRQAKGKLRGEIG